MNMLQRAFHGGFVCAILTAILFVMPQTYQYAPLIGGFVIAGLTARTIGQGFKIGLTAGLFIIPISVVLTVLVTMAPLSGTETGITILLRSLQGMGRSNIVFYAVFIYFLALYTGLAGGLFGGLGGMVGRVVQPFMRELNKQ